MGEAKLGGSIPGNSDLAGDKVDCFVAGRGGDEQDRQQMMLWESWHLRQTPIAGRAAFRPT
jgi:hypothetical protein